MNGSLKRTLALVILGIAVWGGWYGWQSWKTRQALEALENVVRSADLNKLLSNPPEEVKNTVDLAVRGISLSQGSDGRKSFDLTANWATLNQKTGTITVREPDVHYMLKNAEGGDARVVYAKSDVGLVEDGNQKISMSGKVHATSEENVLTGELAVFLNTKHTLTFPNGANLDGPTLSGTAAHLIWDLNTNVLTGKKGVRMRWIPASSDSANDTPAADTPNPAQKDAQQEGQS